MVEKSGETVVHADGKRTTHGSAACGPDLRIGRNQNIGPTEDGEAGTLRRPSGFGRV